ncbi:hypothetical protein RND81_07G095400 [Saponaria officinalis]|uniref:WEB family protein n=1 Tax=Saponaria officinalis TaxID=3572 RepID=A0AAW1JPV2_SAPOF
MSSKTKTGLFQTPVSKPSPTTPRGKLGSSASLKSDGDSPSPNPRFSIDRASPKTVTPRPVSRSSSRVSTPDKLQPRVSKPSELQAQLQAAQDDLKKAKEKLVLSEKEKSQALNDLKDAKKLADEANEKLHQALAAQKQAEESSEIEKFHAAELGHAGIEASRKKEEELNKELESVKSQLLSPEDMANFLAATEELQRVKQELAMVIETKNQALAHADDATKIAEIQAEKVEFLSAELARLKSMLELKAEDESSENGIVTELRCELGSVREELEKANSFEQNFVEKEIFYEKNVADLKSELETLREQLDKAKACERDLAEKGKSYEKIVAEMTAELAFQEQELKRAKIFERDVIEKGQLHETSMAELSLKLASLEQQLSDAKVCEQGLIEKEKSYEKIVEELKSNLNYLEQDLEESKASKKVLVDREKSHDIIITELKSEIGSLKQALDKAEGLEEKLVEKDAFYERTVTGLESEIGLLTEMLEKAKSVEEEIVAREKLNEKVVRDLEFELRSVKEELHVARSFEEKVTQMEEVNEQMNVELEAARMGELYALNSLDEWKMRAEELEHKVAETTESERKVSESLESVMRLLAENSDALHEAESEVVALKEKVSLLETSLVKREEDSEVLECRLRKADEEAVEAAKVIESVRSELETIKEEKTQAVENEKLAAFRVQELLEEKNVIANELDTLKEDEEKSKRAMESLTLALHEVSAEAREAKERLLSSQEEREYFETQIEHLQLVVKSTSEKYETMLEDSNREIDRLTSMVEQSSIEFATQMDDLKAVLKASNDKYESMVDESKNEFDHLTDTLEKSRLEHDSEKTEWKAKEVELLTCVKRVESSFEESKAEWEEKEVQLVNGLKRSEDEKLSMEKEVMRLMNLLRETEEKVVIVQEEGSRLKSEAGSLQKALDDAEADFLNLKDDLQRKENELENVTRENEELCVKENAYVLRIDELTKSLEEAKVQHRSTDNGELSDSDKEYDLLPKVVEFSEENGHLGEHKPQQKDGVENEFQTGVIYCEEVNEKPTTPEKEDRVRDESSGSEAKMWESYKVDREFSTEMETEQGSVDDEAESRADNAESVDYNGNPSENGSNSDSKQQKKKKPLYRKFGNLLKKGITNPK